MIFKAAPLGLLLDKNICIVYNKDKIIKTREVFL